MLRQPPPTPGDAFRIVLIYDRLATAARALATYAPLTRELAGEFKPLLRVWRMDTVAEGDREGPAHDDIELAELIIITASGNETCPQAFRHWQGGAEHVGRKLPHGIVALIGPGDDPGDSEGSWRSVLLRGAKQIHPDVYVYEPPEPPAGPGTRENPAAAVHPRLSVNGPTQPSETKAHENLSG